MTKHQNDIVHWSDLSHAAFNPAQRQTLLAVLLSGTLIMIGLGIAFHELNFYLAAVVFLTIGASIAAQRTNEEEIQISLREDELQVGSKTYPIAELAGFWLEETDSQLMIHIESRRSVLPISLSYRNRDANEARTNFTEVLSELEPREKTLNDKIAEWLKL